MTQPYFPFLFFFSNKNLIHCSKTQSFSLFPSLFFKLAKIHENLWKYSNGVALRDVIESSWVIITIWNLAQCLDSKKMKTRAQQFLIFWVQLLLGSKKALFKPWICILISILIYYKQMLYIYIYIALIQLYSLLELLEFEFASSITKSNSNIY